MKTYDVFLSEDALNDLHNGTEFYNRQEQGVGDYFWDCLISDFESLTLCAGVHKKVSGFHQMFAKRFPYTIYYTIFERKALVSAVLPMRRNPEWISEQIKIRH
jgi:hypothetical protein